MNAGPDDGLLYIYIYIYIDNSFELCDNLPHKPMVKKSFYFFFFFFFFYFFSSYPEYVNVMYDTVLYLFRV